jgi:hypothetical protein
LGDAGDELLVGWVGGFQEEIGASGIREGHSEPRGCPASAVWHVSTGGPDAGTFDSVFGEAGGVFGAGPGAGVPADIVANDPISAGRGEMPFEGVGALVHLIGEAGRHLHFAAPPGECSGFLVPVHTLGEWEWLGAGGGEEDAYRGEETLFSHAVLSEF